MERTKVKRPALRRATAGVVLITLAGMLAAGAPAVAQGFRLDSLQGQHLAEADLAHGATVIVVWASWSPRARDIVERVQPLASRWSGKARVLTVNFQEDRQTVEGFLAGRDLGAPVFLDASGAFSRKYAVATLPVLLVLKDGQVLYRGKLPDDPDQVLAGLLG